MSLFLLILGIILIISLIVVHEFGHFIVAKRNGVAVEEFGIFFPPRIWAKKMKGGHEFSINLLPLGGFVKLKGEHDADKQPHSYGQANLWAKTKIMLAGIFMNIIAAFVIFTIVAIVGTPQLLPGQFTINSGTTARTERVLAVYVEPNSPASLAGLKPQDQMVSIKYGNTTKYIETSNDLPGITKEFAGKNVTLTYIHDGKTINKNTTLRSNELVNSLLKSNQPAGYLGVEPVDFQLIRSSWYTAPLVALGLMKQITVLTFKGIGVALEGLFTGNTSKATSQISGPVGVVMLLKNGSVLGYQFVLFLIAVISLSLAIINVLPIPALDGGRLFVTYLTRLIYRRPIRQKTEEIVAGSGLALLLVLLVLITIVDIHRHY